MRWRTGDLDPYRPVRRSAVGNSGQSLTGAAEESSINEVPALFETNFHGVVRMTNAVLPIMRDQGRGRILNVGSGLGLIPAPYNAYYSATKHALEGYSESLDHEVREFGVRVAVIEPATTRTSFESSTAVSDAPVAAYGASRAKYLAADTAESVAETIVPAAGDLSPRLRYPSGKAARQAAFARRYLPRRLFGKILHTQFGAWAGNCTPRGQICWRRHGAPVVESGGRDPRPVATQRVRTLAR